MGDDGTIALAPELEDLWSDYRRSLKRRNKSPQTAAIYRKAYATFWRWAAREGLPPDPCAIDHRTINCWSDALAIPRRPATVV